VVVNGARPHKVKTDGVESRRVDLPVEALEPGKNTISFEGAPEGVLFRLSLRCIRAGRALQPIDHGLKVTRDLYLLNPYTGQNIKPLKDGDTVPAGSYISARTQVRHDDGRMRYTLVRCPKPSGCQIVPLSDRRFTHWISQHAQLREDKSDRVLWHHEEIGGSLWDQAVFFCELEGEFVIPPASAELMYEPDTLGSSAAMTLRIKTEESP